MIEVKNLSKAYGSLQAVRDVSFAIQRGEIVGFLGPNGAGKSTTMKILTGFIPQSDGTVKVDGTDINEDSLAVRKRIGYLPESNALYTDMLVYDYLEYVATIRGVAKKERHARIATVANLCGLADRVGQQIGTLSKGFRQRVGLAQALIHDPDILILDEPTSGLDPNQIVEIRNLIKQLGENRTIILSTHNLPEVMATCNRMLIIHNGSLVADGTPATLQAREEDVQRIKVVLAGADTGEIEGALGQLEGADAVVGALTAEPNAVAFEVQGARDANLRPAIYQLAVDKGWTLVELHRQVLDLEGIFRKLTQVV
ncbi:MAG: ATP-binding cassette domain-containing protein [Myxococcota bacterium]|nr:ATP-binding cassette domain-containing protein [Myxococcota bacterium]